MQVLAALNLLNILANTLIGALNLMGATKQVSDIIAARIAAGRTDWTDDERNQVTTALTTAKAQADADITAAGG